jgi:formiminotetrahydrofolate cyclodeaminase
MPSLASLPFTQLLDRIASPEPTPGGGSVSAVAAACGAALGMMVAGLPRTRHDRDEERAALHEVRDTLAGHRARLVELADLDAEAFDQLMAAFRLPKTNDDEKGRRRTAIQTAMRGATTVPLETALVCAAVLKHIEKVAAAGNPSAASDLAVAIGLLRAAADGAAANVRTNLGSVSDSAFTTDTAQRLSAVLGEIAASAQIATAALEG